MIVLNEVLIGLLGLFITLIIQAILLAYWLGKKFTRIDERFIRVDQRLERILHVLSDGEFIHYLVYVNNCFLIKLCSKVNY
ncbi:MAG: hypothetical protein DRN53_01225 [Thermoprotei archaeon]|nr:MAG: hypothetical protein DRN53_01225 [Thermoprotei archaeon]